MPGDLAPAGNTPLERLQVPQALLVRCARESDLPAIVELHRRVSGPGRFTLSAYRIRERTPDVSPYCQVAELDGSMLGAVRFTEVSIGHRTGALLLGPLCVLTSHAKKGIGGALIAAGITAAQASGRELVVLIGNASYYERFGFRPVPRGQIVFPGPVDPARILAKEISPGALDDFRGEIAAIRSA